MALHTLFSLMFFATATYQLPQTGTISCPEGYQLLGTSCYFVSAETHSGTSADHFCQSHGGRAAVVESQEEMRLLKEELLDRTVHLGVTAQTSREDLFKCSLKLGEHSGFTNFHAGEPDNYGGEDCVVAESAYAFAWEDVQCTQAHHVLCKAQAAVTPDSPYCGEGAHLFEESACFYVENAQNYTWSEALTACTDRGMALASVHSQQEQDFIWGFNDEVELFIGFNDLAVEDVFVWSDSSPVDYVNWYSGQPNQGTSANCTVMYHGEGQWGDAPCTLSYGFVCRALPRQ